MRISTKNHGQTTETQAVALRDYAGNRGFDIVQEYSDEGISGSKDSRPALDCLMKDARARRFDVVIVVRFDRFARSVSHLLRALEEFNHVGLDFISVSEALGTSSPVGKMIFTVLGAVAELERNLIRERVQMGIHRARKQGKKLGRPKADVDPRQVAGLRANGYSRNEIAEKLNVGGGTVERAFKSLSPKTRFPGTKRNRDLKDLSAIKTHVSNFPKSDVIGKADPDPENRGMIRSRITEVRHVLPTMQSGVSCRLHKVL